MPPRFAAPNSGPEGEGRGEPPLDPQIESRPALCARDDPGTIRGAIGSAQMRPAMRARPEGGPVSSLPPDLQGRIWPLRTGASVTETNRCGA